MLNVSDTGNGVLGSVKGVKCRYVEGLVVVQKGLGFDGHLNGQVGFVGNLLEGVGFGASEGRVQFSGNI